MYELPPVAVRVTEPPEQIEGFAGDMLPDGFGFTVTSTVLEAGTLQVPSIIMAL